MASPVESSRSSPELSVVMPVFNEGAVIHDVLRAWTGELRRLGMHFELRVYDDGSTDSTPETVDRAAREEPRIVPVHQPNRGHGPTVLRGYAEARGEWIFQVDSDDEVPPDAFADLWRRREDYDFLLARRRGRGRPMGRRLITWVSAATVRVLFGAGIRDVNTPFRLMRRAALERLLPSVPAHAFAPNVILSGLAVRQGLRIYEGTVAYRPLRAAQAPASVRFRHALRAFGETVRVAVKARI